MSKATSVQTIAKRRLTFIFVINNPRTIALRDRNAADLTRECKRCQPKKWRKLAACARWPRSISLPVLYRSLITHANTIGKSSFSVFRHGHVELSREGRSLLRFES